MLEITDRAANAIQSLVASQAPDSFVRICPSETAPSRDGAKPGPIGLRLDLVPEPNPDDEVVLGPEGTQVCIAAAIVPVLENKVLDSEPDARGWPTFVFRAA
jgi:Fe-S cluster assembly iron-binding protein IscA